MANNMDLDKLQREDHDRLVRLEGKIDTFIALQGDVKAEISDHESRMRLLESESNSNKGTLKGIKWVIGIVITVIGILEPLVLLYLSKG